MKRLLLVALLNLFPMQSRALKASMQIVIDESDGMSATVNGKTLFRRAVDAARKSIEGRSTSSRGELSWRTVGGGKGSNDAACEATRVVAPAGVTAGVLLQAAGKETPRGPRPLVAAMEAAQADLPRDRQRATVLITSGTDTCGRNVCLTASDLRKSDGLGLVRVILVGSDPQAEGKLACLGPIVRVSDPDKLQAKIAEAIDTLDRPAEVTVTASEGGADVAGRVELFTHEDDRPFATGKTGDPLQLLAGTYHVHVTRTGREREGAREGWRRNVEIVSDAHLNVRVPVGQEQAEVVASVQFNGAPAPAGTRVAIFHVGESEGAIAEGFPDESIHVPAGKYDVRAIIPGGPIDSIQVWKPEVKLLPGQKATVSLAAIQKRGELQATVFSGDEKIQDATLMLLPSGSREASDAMFAPGNAIPVPVGKYTLMARLPTPGGDLQSFKDNVVVSPDQTTSVRMELGALGHLTVEVTGRKPEDGLTITLQKSGTETDLGIIEAFTDYLLPAGTYDLRVEDHSKGPPSIYWYRGAKVPAGEKSVARVKPKSGRD